MAVFVTIKCDGMMPPGSRERCRAGISAEAEIFDAELAGDVISLRDAVDAARRHGWSDEFVAFAPSLQFCPSCTRHRREAPPA